MSSIHTVALDVNSFEAFASDPTTLALVDFWAPWCGPCRTLAPVLDRIGQDYAGQLRIGKVNVDEVPELAAKFGVRGIPALVLFKNGVAISQSVGARPREELTNWINEAI